MNKKEHNVFKSVCKYIIDNDWNEGVAIAYNNRMYYLDKIVNGEIHSEERESNTSNEFMTLMYDGGILYSIISNEFGTSLSESFTEFLDEITMENNVDYDYINSWSLGFYRV